MAGRLEYEAAEMAAEARRQRTVVDEMTSSLDAEAFAWRPAARKWSVGECLDHLTLMNRIYLDSIDEVLRPARQDASDARSRPPERSGRHGWMGDVFVRTLEPPPRLRTPTFPRTTPAAQRDRDVVIEEFLATQDRLALTIDAARDLDLAGVRMRSPFVRMLRLSLGQAFGAMLAHNRRHIWQAERVLERRV
jgi:hypothetical protein